MRKLLLLLLVMPLVHFLDAQGPNTTAFPSVNNNFLGATGGASGIGVDAYTGSAQINIPICNLSSRDLVIPVSLNYVNGKGVRLQDYATCIGLGWQLNAGGGISRVVRGFPDEYSNGYLGTNLWGQQIKNAITNNQPIPNAVTGYNGSTYGTPTADGEPDIFYVKTPFFSFQFTFDENAVPVVANNNGIKIIPINFYNSYSYSNSSFKVIDDAGNQYFFGSTISAVEQTTTKLFGTNYNFPTTWYLDKIVTFNNKDVVNFTYTSSAGIEEVTQHYVTTRLFYYGCTSDKADSVTNAVYVKYVSTITSSTGAISFSYAFDRRDILNAARLTSVKLQAFTPSSTLTDLQTYSFYSSYFGDPTTNKDLLRLRLDRITVAGNTPSTSTAVEYRKFGYYQTENLPSRRSQSFDYWGYYNYLPAGADPLTYPTYRVPNEDKAKANILVSIKDMTGATWQLDYESNKYFRASDHTNVTIGGLRVKTVSQKLATGDNLQTNYYYLSDNGNSSGQIVSGSYPNLGWIWSYYVFEVISEAQSNIYDLNGTFVGYSRVKTVHPNGGFVISTFSNFNDTDCGDINSYYNNVFDINTIPNITSTTSKAYKRGLLKSQSVFTASGKILSEDINTYTSLTSPAEKKSWAFKWYTVGFNGCNAGFSGSSSTYYSSLVENYRLSQTLHKDYDQNNNNTLERTVYYAYANNKRSVKTISSSSSKDPNNINRIQTLYYPDDPSIPMLNATEQSTVNALIAQNCVGVLVHQNTSTGGAVTEMHHSYEVSNADPTKIFLKSTSSYKAGNLVQQSFFNYDDERSTVISSKPDGGKFTSVLYGYNSAYPIATVKNATSYNTFTQSTDYGNMYLNGPSSTSFVVSYTGTVSLALYLGGYPGSGPVSATINYTLSGPTTQSGSLCLAYGGATCYYPSSVNLTNIAPGNYTLSYYIVSNNVVSPPYLHYVYPKNISSTVSEFYYEGFEQQSTAAIGNAHTGKAYFDGTSSAYYVNFALPNSRSYIIQWWSFQNSKWTFNEQPYSGPRTVSGIIDDIRIFPTDALMTTYSYDRIVGKTGEIDPSGRTTTYEYDGMGRVHIVRGNDQSITSVTCYSVQGKEVECKVYSSQDQSNYYYSQNCGTGQDPDPYYVSIPAGMFTSFSQEDANAQATQYGQNQANLYGNCHSSDIAIYGSNYTGYYYWVELYNVNTGQDYWFSINSYGSNTIGYVPEGTYDIYLGSSDYYNYRTYYAGCSYYTNGYGSASFYNVPLNAYCNSISIY